MTFRPHPRQALFMAEPPSQIVIAGIGRPSGSAGFRWLRRPADWLRDAEPARCQRRVEVIRQAPEGAVGLAGIDMHAVRPCGGRLIDGKCEFCDVTTIEGDK